MIFKVKNPEEVSENFRDFAALGNAVRYARDLCNEPANYLTPEVFAADIKRLEYLGLDIEILDRKQLEEKEFNMLLSVAQGSVNEPKVAILNLTSVWSEKALPLTPEAFLLSRQTACGI